MSYILLAILLEAAFFLLQTSLNLRSLALHLRVNRQKQL